jgi:hypothetical protein
MVIFATRLAAVVLLSAPMIVGTARPCSHRRSGYLQRHDGEPVTSPPIKPVEIIREHFFCFPHNLGFSSQAEFFGHLQTSHHVSRQHAPAHLLEVGNSLVFFSF